ncbi:MAG: glycosyltransferase [Thermoguttaceae bacterium]|nr:glycosyltransferase [Thermoguttaceae bacterium]
MIRLNPPTPRPDVSLIVTCYNKPETLRLVLESALAQTSPPSEIIVADDGSKVDNLVVTRDLRKTASIPIVHAWQTDEGKRVNRSRNNALSLATGEYVVLIDGDCLLPPLFIEDHLAFARPGRVVGGTRVHVDPERQARILATRDARVCVLTPHTTKRLHSIRSPFLARFLSLESAPGDCDVRHSKVRIVGANLSFWLADARRVNGFNELYVGYGENDSEFINRLCLFGLRRCKMRCMGASAHFKHSGRTRVKTDDFERKVAESLEENGWRVKDEYGLSRALREGIPLVER